MTASHIPASQAIRSVRHHISKSLLPTSHSRNNQKVSVAAAGVNTVVTVAVYDKALKLSRASVEGPRLGQALNFQVRFAGGICRVCGSVASLHARMPMCVLFLFFTAYRFTPSKVDCPLVRVRVWSCVCLHPVRVPCDALVLGGGTKVCVCVCDCALFAKRNTPNGTQLI